MADETPLFLQYFEQKKQHPNEVLFFRVGDFYEMFDSDAVEVSKLLNLTLTHRGDRHMCGVPYHAAKIYIARLLRLGKKIAIAEQIGEIPKPGQGLTERKVIEIITPGTATESEYLDGTANNYLASFFMSRSKCGFAYIDVTTGEFKATSFDSQSASENFQKEIGRCCPREILLPDSLKNSSFVLQTFSERSNISVSWYPDWHFNADQNYDRLLKHFKTVNLNSFGLTKDSPEVPPAGFLLDYLEKTTNSQTPHVEGITVYHDNQYLVIDDSSRKNLEILSNLRDGSFEFSLLECLNYTKTSMGMRQLHNFLMFPLTDCGIINERQRHVELFVKDSVLQRNVRNHLDGILDIERLSGRIAMDKAHAKDLKVLQNSLSLWIKAHQILRNLNFVTVDTEAAQKIISLIENSIEDDPPTIFQEGGIIKRGWSQELDHWRDVHDNFSNVLDQYAEEERQKTGISNLRIKSSGNMGYFIEISKGKIDKVPDHFVAKRSLVNVERFKTEKLQELEASLTESGGRIIELEHELFLEVRNELKNYVGYLRRLSFEIAYTDCISALAEAASRNNWCRPVVDESKAFDIKDGRHPVVEKHLPSGEFVPNPLALMTDEDSCIFALITGPNMAGKSTYLRQNALIALLAQIGSFVPCSSAHIGIVDEIFCRVGASDNLARGESTFLVEMSETARILRAATDRSLVIMDEVGRGTSTEDGLSIAWAVSEYLLNKIKCKTLFATHYHELTRMEHPLLKRLCMAVNENGKDVVFLRKVIDGAAANSYGIHVARLAGIPDAVINRASCILNKIQKEAQENPLILSGEISSENVGEFLQPENNGQSLTGSLFSDEEMVLDAILSVDPNTMTPLQALQLVSEWKSALSGR